MRERQLPADSRHAPSYFSVGDDDLLRRIRDSRVVIFRAVCDGSWAKTQVAILENIRNPKGCRHCTIDIEVGMTLSEFHLSIRPGRKIVFHEEGGAPSRGEDVLFSAGKEPIVRETAKAVFRVDVITCNGRFDTIRPLNEGPERDMD